MKMALKFKQEVLFWSLKKFFCDYLCLAITKVMPEQKERFDKEVADALQQQAREQWVVHSSCRTMIFIYI